MWESFPGVDFLGAGLKFKKRKENSSSLVYVLHNSWKEAFSRRSREVAAKKCTKKCGTRANLMFC